MAEIRESNNLIRVVNLDTLEALGIPFQDGMRAFRRMLGDRMVYLTTRDFSDISSGFGERMAEEAERYEANGQSKRQKADCCRGSHLPGGGAD
ncbi:MAG: hypothetical protein ACE5LG_05170 [Anaerolineae bacterium]